MPSPKSPQDLLIEELKEIHSAERQLSRAIPKLRRRITAEALGRMLEQRQQQGQRLIEEIDACFERMDASKGRPKNPAAEGLLEDMNEHLEEIKDDRMLDAVLLAAIQKLEHYCIAAWGTARSMGQLLGQDEVVKAMERALDEGKTLDAELTKLAEERINPAMLQGAQGDGGGEGRGGRRSGRGGEEDRRGQMHH